MMEFESPELSLGLAHSQGMRNALVGLIARVVMGPYRLMVMACLHLADQRAQKNYD